MTATTDLQKGLNEVVMNKVHRMIDGKAAGVKATMERLINEGKIAQDYIAPIGVNLKAKSHTPIITFSGGQPTDGFTEVEEISSQPLTMNMPDGQFSLHDNAIGQLAERMGIPQRYLRGLASGEPWAITLAAHLLKQESKEVEKILMRNDPEDGVQGGATLWKLTQAITAHARELTPERSRELHELSGQLMNRVKLNK